MSELEENFQDLRKYTSGLFNLQRHVNKCKKAEWILMKKIIEIITHVSSYTNMPEQWAFWMESTSKDSHNEEETET